ncbi:MAG: VOC family protein [Candidatus Limnocylindrales bacterium]
MLRDSPTFPSFSVDDVDTARKFYGETLGLDVSDGPMGVLDVVLNGGQHLMLYPKTNHEPATFTVLNFSVDDLDAAVDDLVGKGVEFEKYDMPELKTNEKGIARDPEGRGPALAWFKDPAGNIVAVMQQG